jgi:putative heme transporter
MSASSGNSRRGGTRTRQRVRTIAQWTVVLGGLGVLAWQLPALAGEADRLGAELAQAQWRWIAVAILLGVAGLVLYGELHRRLLIAGGARLNFRTAQAIHFAENAVSTTLPGVGDAAGFVYATYQLRKRNVDAALAAWSLVLAGTVATIVLILLGILGLGWVGRIPMLVAAPLAALVALAAGACWAVANRSSVLHRCLRGFARLVRRLPVRRVRAKDPEEVARGLTKRIRLLRPGKAEWVFVIVLAGLSWVVEYLSLAASVAALGSPVPWSPLVMGFLVVQASIALQIFPGGAGLAEAGLLGVLVTSGMPVAQAMACVLIYRLINWVGLAVLGWVVYAVQIQQTPPDERTSLRPGRRRGHR